MTAQNLDMWRSVLRPLRGEGGISRSHAAVTVTTFSYFSLSAFNIPKNFLDRFQHRKNSTRLRYMWTLTSLQLDNYYYQKGLTPVCVFSPNLIFWWDTDTPSLQLVNLEILLRSKWRAAVGGTGGLSSAVPCTKIII